MPTAKPRLSVTLSEQQHAVLFALSEVKKVSMSSLVVDVLDATLPALERLTAIVKDASDAVKGASHAHEGMLNDIRHISERQFDQVGKAQAARRAKSLKA